MTIIEASQLVIQAGAMSEACEVFVLDMGKSVKINELIKSKNELGLDLDTSVCSEFEKSMKDKNYLFSNGIDFIYEFFKLESKTSNNFFSKSIIFSKSTKL
mgnify:CR=1 FL=1